jgi:hypothetical protein
MRKLANARHQAGVNFGVASVMPEGAQKYVWWQVGAN